MVKLIVVTPKGELINEDFQIIVAKGDQGEIGILENRLPIIVKISEGYVKAESEKRTVFVYVVSGILDNVNSTVTIVAEEAMLGDSIEDAKANLMQRREDVKAYNRKTKIDFVQAEKDLAKHIKESKASQV